MAITCRVVYLEGMTKNPELSTEEKIALLRGLCQGDGVLPETFVEKEAELRELADVRPSTMSELFSSAAEGMTPGKYKDAFLNALWARGGKNLTERRTEFLAKQGDITYRTLIRHEQEGAEIFLKFLDAQVRSEASDYRRFDDDDDDFNVDLEAMRIRVTRLESVVQLMAEALSNANSVIDDLIQGTTKNSSFVDEFEKRYRDYNWGVDRNNKSLLDHLQDMPGYLGLYLDYARRDATPSSESQPGQD